MRNMSNGFGRQPTKPLAQNTKEPAVSSSYKLPATTGLKVVQNSYKENIASNTKLGTVRNTTSSGFQKPAETKITARRDQPSKQEYVAQQPRQVNKPAKPTASRGAPFRQPMTVEQNLEQCRECGRKFNEKALEKHEKICKKVFSQKRKVFNSAKQRIVSKEQVQILKKNQASHLNEPKTSVAPLPKWKQDSLAFRVAMKQAKGVEPTAQQMKLIQQVKETGSGLKTCKFCNRKFNEVAAEKHIPFCERKAKQLNSKKPTRR